MASDGRRVRAAFARARSIGHYPTMYLRNRRRTASLVITLGIAGAALATGCGQKGDLYFAEDDPQRAERDARGKAAPFPLPPEDAEWPPPDPEAAGARGD
jgi:predicted small lipoprotein YifL